MRQYSEYSPLVRCVRSMLVIGNFIFCLLGCAVIAVGIYLLVERIHFVQWVFGTQLMAVACGLIIATGSIMFLISFIGCFGSLFENRTLILVYCAVLAIVFMTAVMGSVIAIVYQVWVYNMVRVFMLESLITRYGYTMDNSYNNLITRSWDEAQEKWQCCSVGNSSWSIYRQSNWYKDLPGKQEADKPYVPATCCKRDADNNYIDKFTCQMSADGPPGRTYGVRNKYLYYQGCLDAGVKILRGIAIYFIVIGFVFAAIVIACVACAMIFYRHL